MLDRAAGTGDLVGMLTLSLLRHAKSNWEDRELGDHERPLAKRGARDAPRIGALLAERDWIPDLIVCSGAVRARATVTLMLSQLGAARPAIIFDDALYLAEPPALLGRIALIESAHRHVMLVGHNPGLHALALAMTGSGDRKQLAQLALGFPTAGLAVIDFDAVSWDEITAGAGRLRAFVTPRRID